MGIEELLAAEAEASEPNVDAPLKPGTKVTRGHGRAKTLQIRLNYDEFTSLSRVAEDRGIPVSTLARDLLLRELNGAGEDPQAVIARMRSDLDALAAQLT